MSISKVVSDKLELGSGRNWARRVKQEVSAGDITVLFISFAKWGSGSTGSAEWHGISIIRGDEILYSTERLVKDYPGQGCGRGGHQLNKYILGIESVDIKDGVVDIAYTKGIYGGDPPHEYIPIQ
jgi:hypothetical protein